MSASITREAYFLLALACAGVVIVMRGRATARMVRTARRKSVVYRVIKCFVFFGLRGPLRRTNFIIEIFAIFVHEKQKLLHHLFKFVIFKFLLGFLCTAKYS